MDNSTREQRDETAEAVADQDDKNPVHLVAKNERRALADWPVGNVFSEWPPDDISRWPQRFVCSHCGIRAKRLSYWFYERAHTVVIDGERGMLLSRRDRSLKRSLGFSASPKRMAEVDNKKASHIFEGTGHRLFANGEELARLLVTLPPYR
jgi:hypothetical protein